MEATFRIVYLLNKYTGFLPYDNSKSAFIRRHMLGFIILTMTATLLNAIWYEYPKMKIVLLILNVLTSCISAIIRYLFAIIYREKLATLMKTVRDEFWNEGKNEEEKQIIENFGWSAFRYHLFQVGTMVLAFPLTVRKLMLYIFKVIIPHKLEVQKILLYRNWYSANIDIYAEPFYGILFAIQFFGIMSMSILIPTVDVQYTYMMYSFSGQLSVLTKRIETFDRNRNSKESQQNLYKCVEQHQKLTNYCEEINSIFSYLLFFEVFITVAYIALAGYLIIAFDFTSQIVIQKTCTCSATLLQLFGYCYTAQMLTNNGLKIAEAVYSCNWVDAPKNVKNIIYIMLIRAQKPLHIYVGSFTPATIETFQQVLKTTFSIFTMMKAVMVDETEN